MAITQISRIQHRRGLKEELPQLAAGELGWAVDTQELYIGNGTIAEGAPEVGNTKIITEDDNILSSANTYTFVGNTVAPVVTGVDNNSPISRTLQQKLDDFANVKDFGAVGDGSTDDTAAINRAIANLITVEATGKEKRKLYFPGGVYYITGDTLKLYPHISLVGDGPTSTFIKQYDATQTHLIETVDRNGNTGAGIGNDSAETPQGISCSGICFNTQSNSDVFQINQAQDMHFENCHFVGTYTNQDSTAPSIPGSALVTMTTTAAYPCKRISFHSCTFSNSEYAVDTSDNIEDVTFSACEFKNLYRAFNLGEASDGSTNNKTVGPTGFVITACRFDEIDAEAVKIWDAGGTPHGNIVSACSFRDVGRFSDDSSDVAVMQFDHANNFSIGNYFYRDDLTASLGGTVYNESPAKHPVTLADNQSAAANVVDPFSNSAVRFDLQREHHVTINYIVKRNTARRTGTLSIAGTGSGIQVSDDFTENSATGITFSVTTDGNLQYTSTSTGNTATFKYKVNKFI